MNLLRWSSWALPVVIAAVLLGLVHESSLATWIARIGVLVYVIAEFPRQGAMARGLVLVGAILAILTMLLDDAPAATLLQALDRFAFLGAFIGCLQLLRVAGEGSPLLRQCGEYLIQQPPQRRYLTLSLGSGLFGILLNVGVLNLLGVMSLRGNTLSAAGGHQAVWWARRRRMFTAILRGFALLPLISPLGISLAVILAAMPELRWIDIAPPAIATAGVMFLLGWLFDRLTAPRHLAGLAPPRVSLSPRPMLIFCALVLAVVALTFVLASLLAVRLPVGVIFSAPLSALIWMAWQRRRLAGGTGLRRAGASLIRRTHLIFPAMRGEIVILGGAGYLGVVLGRLLPVESITAALLGSGISGHSVAFTATLTVIVAAQAGLNPIVTVTLITTLLPDPGLLGLSPPLYATALMSGWALAVMSSPMTAAMLVMGRLLDSSPYRIGYRWNGPYILLTLAVLAAWYVVLGQWL